MLMSVVNVCRRTDKWNSGQERRIEVRVAACVGMWFNYIYQTTSSDGDGLVINSH